MKSSPFILTAVLLTPSVSSAAESVDLDRFVAWIVGRWDNLQQVEREESAKLPENQRHHRYPMDYQPVKTAMEDGVVFAIHNYGDGGFEGELRRISLHRFSWSEEHSEIAHQFLFVQDKERFGPDADALSKLAELGWDDVRTNPGCTMYWRWSGTHFEGATREGACVTSSFTPEPIRIEARGELWPDRLVRHDINMTMEGEIIPRHGGDTPEEFSKAD